MIEKQHAEIYEEQIRNILLDLYLVLAREKISVSNMTVIRQVCDDFVSWVQLKKVNVLEQDQTYIRLLLHKKILWLLARRSYIKIRHKIAVRIKNMKWVKK